MPPKNLPEKDTVAFENPSKAFRLGMFANADHCARPIPAHRATSALLTSNDKTSVFVEVAPWTFERREVDTDYPETSSASQCHSVRKGQLFSPNSRSPTFQELAITPGMSAAALTVALTTPHAGMPRFVLTANQRNDVVAYILSLR